MFLNILMLDYYNRTNERSSDMLCGEKRKDLVNRDNSFITNYLATKRVTKALLLFRLSDLPSVSNP